VLRVSIKRILLRLTVEKQHSAAVTSAMFGVFRNEEETRSEFLSLIRQRPNGV
jgi:GTP cyclohydrolase IA